MKTFWPIIAVVMGIGLLFFSAGFAEQKKILKGNATALLNQSVKERKYSQMISSKAKEIIVKEAEQGDLPFTRMPLSFTRKVVADDNLDVQGIMIDDSDWIIFAKVRLDLGIEIGFNSKGLPITFPKLNIPEGLMKDMSNHLGPFIINYIMSSTMDVVLDRQIYISGTQGWEAAGSILKKGNYLWSIGPGGILLESSNVTALIPFKTPLKGSLKEWFEKAVEDIRMATVEDVINQNLIKGSLIHVPVKLSLLSGKKKGILVDYIADTIILK